MLVIIFLDQEASLDSPLPCVHMASFHANITYYKEQPLLNMNSSVPAIVWSLLLERGESVFKQTDNCHPGVFIPNAFRPVSAGCFLICTLAAQSFSYEPGHDFSSTSISFISKNSEGIICFKNSVTGHEHVSQ